MKSQSQRIKHVLDIAKMGRLIKNQSEVAEHILNKKGNPISQPYMSQVVTGGIKHIPPSFIEQLVEAYPFINIDYIIDGEGKPFTEQGLRKFLYREHKDDTINKIDSVSDLIDYVNSEYDYKLYLNRHFPETGTPLNPIENPQHLERVIELVDTMKRYGLVSTDKEFCEKVGIQSQLIVNFRINTVKDVSKDTLYKILVSLPQVSADWLMLGRGSLFRDEKDLYNLFQVLKDDISEIKKHITDDPS